MTLKSKLLTYVAYRNKAKLVNLKINPYEAHRKKMEYIISARGAKHELLIYAIRHHQVIPTIFSSWQIPVNKSIPKHIIKYLIKRHTRDEWINEINSIMELGYTYP